jgi:hypothetical protein
MGIYPYLEAIWVVHGHHLAMAPYDWIFKYLPRLVRR